MNNQTVNELNNRDLDSCLFSIICITTNIYFRKGDETSNKKTLYIFFGCNLRGVRKFITATISDDYRKTSDWYNFFLNLKQRKLNTILYASIPNNKTMKDALSLAYKEITCFTSCFDPINKIFKYFSSRYSSNVFNLIKHIYLSSDITEYTLALNDFYEEFSSNQFLIDLLQDELKSIQKYYNYNIIIRKHVFAFYFSREAIKKISVFSHSKYYFTNVDEYIEIMLPFIKIIESRMYCSKKDWLELLNFIYPDKKELIKCYL